MFQTLQALLSQAEEEAAKVATNEKRATVRGTDGKDRAVEDAGGREHVRTIVLDINNVASSPEHAGRLRIERAASGAASTRAVSPTALAVPVNEPMYV